MGTKSLGAEYGLIIGVYSFFRDLGFHFVGNSGERPARFFPTEVSNTVASPSRNHMGDIYPDDGHRDLFSEDVV